MSHLKELNFNTSGSYSSSDLINYDFNLWRSSNSTFELELLQKIGYWCSFCNTTLGNGHQTMYINNPQLISNGTTVYFYITADISPTAALGDNLQVEQINISDLKFNVEGTQSGTAQAGGMQTIAGPVITLSDGEVVAAGNVLPGSNYNLLSSFTISTEDYDVSLNYLKFTTSGTYSSTDLNDLDAFNLWSSTNSTFDGTAQVVGEWCNFCANANLNPGLQTMYIYSQPSISSGGTLYYYITTNISSNAVLNDNIQVEELNISDLYFSVQGTESGTAQAGGVQTIAVPEMFLSDGENIPAANIAPGSSSNLIGSFTLNASNYNITLEGVNFTTSGNYTGIWFCW